MASGFELIAASGRGDIAESIRLIEECHVALDEHDAMGQTPLHVRHAACPAADPLLQWLPRTWYEAADSPVHRCVMDTRVRLQLAAYHGHRKLVKYLLTKGADVNALTNVRVRAWSRPQPAHGKGQNTYVLGFTDTGWVVVTATHAGWHDGRSVGP